MSYSSLAFWKDLLILADTNAAHTEEPKQGEIATVNQSTADCYDTTVGYSFVLNLLVLLLSDELRFTF